MLSLTELMPKVHCFVPLHMCIQVCQKDNSDGWCYTEAIPRTIFDQKIFNSQREGDFCTLTK